MTVEIYSRDQKTLIGVGRAAGKKNPVLTLRSGEDNFTVALASFKSDEAAAAFLRAVVNVFGVDRDTVERAIKSDKLGTADGGST